MCFEGHIRAIYRLTPVDHCTVVLSLSVCIYLLPSGGSLTSCRTDVFLEFPAVQDQL